jgi:hypothetical protein
VVCPASPGHVASGHGLTSNEYDTALAMLPCAQSSLTISAVQCLDSWGEMFVLERLNRLSICPNGRGICGFASNVESCRRVGRCLILMSTSTYRAQSHGPLYAGVGPTVTSMYNDAHNERMLVRVILAILTASARAVSHEVGSSGIHIGQGQFYQIGIIGKHLGRVEAVETITV